MENMENKQISNLPHLSQFKSQSNSFSYLFDNFKYQLISKYSNNSTLSGKIKYSIDNCIKYTFGNKSEDELKFQNKKNFFYYLPPTLLFLNLFNYFDVIDKQIFFTTDKMRDILTKLFKINFNPSSNDTVLNFFKLMGRSMIKTVTFNFDLFMFVNKSLIYSVTLFPFLYIYQSKGELNNRDLFKLFMFSGVVATPLSIIHDNYTNKKFIEEKNKINYFKINKNLHLVLLKTIVDNFGTLLVYFNLLKFFSTKLENKLVKLEESDKLPILKETINSNETFQRIEILYIKREEIITGRIDYSLPVVLASAITALLYTPFDYTSKFLLSNTASIRQMITYLTTRENSTKLHTQENMILRFRYLFLINLGKIFLRYGMKFPKIMINSILKINIMKNMKVLILSILWIILLANVQSRLLEKRELFFCGANCRECSFFTSYCTECYKGYYLSGGYCYECNSLICGDTSVVNVGGIVGGIIGGIVFIAIIIIIIVACARRRAVVTSGGVVMASGGHGVVVQQPGYQVPYNQPYQNVPMNNMNNFNNMGVNPNPGQNYAQNQGQNPPPFPVNQNNPSVPYVHNQGQNVNYPNNVTPNNNYNSNSGPMINTNNNPNFVNNNPQGYQNINSVNVISPGHQNMMGPNKVD